MARREVQWVEWVPPVRSPALVGGLALAAVAVMALVVMALAPSAGENAASSRVAGAPGNERAAERMISAIAADVRQHLEATYPAGLFALD